MGTGLRKGTRDLGKLAHRSMQVQVVLGPGGRGQRW
jgi:hypothetical protein